MSTESQQQIAREAAEKQVRNLVIWLHIDLSEEQERELRVIFVDSILSAIERATDSAWSDGYVDGSNTQLATHAQPQRSEQQEWTEEYVDERLGRDASWPQIIEAANYSINAALADERQRSDIKLATTISKEEHELFALNRELEVNNRQLKQRLLSAQAAIEKVKYWFDHMGDSSSKGINLGQLREVVFATDLSALREHDEKITYNEQSAIQEIDKLASTSQCDHCLLIHDICSKHEHALERHDAEVREPLVEALEPFARAAGELTSIGCIKPSEMFVWKPSSNIRETNGITGQDLINARDALVPLGGMKEK